MARMSKPAAVAALALVIVGAAAVLAWRQLKPKGYPAWIYEREHVMILAEEPFTEKSFTFRVIQDAPIDPETGYRVISGKLWTTPTVCAASEAEGEPHQIPSLPNPPEEHPPADMNDEAYWEARERSKLLPRKCPKCGKEANPRAMEQ